MTRRPKRGEFWVSRWYGERVLVMQNNERSEMAHVAVKLRDVGEGQENIDLGWRGLCEFMEAYEYLHTLGEAWNQAHAEIP